MNRRPPHRVRETPDGKMLVTRRCAVSQYIGIPTTEHYIRKVCRPVACDVASRVVLYDVDELAERFPTRRVAA